MLTLILLALALVVQVVGFVIVILALYRVRGDLEELHTKLDKLTRLSLNPRTRLGQTGMQSGATTAEQIGARVGRASAGKRVVFGGEVDSLLNQQLKNTPGVADDE